MAFRMNRPVIKGTANHKASIAKAKATSVVSQSRTKADAGLIAASNALGKSYKPSEIDFELDKINIDVPEKKEKKPLTPEEQAAKDAKKQQRKAKRKKIGKNILDKAGKLVEGVGTLVGGALLAPVAIGGGLFKLGKNIVDEFGNIVEGAKTKAEEPQAAKDAENNANKPTVLEPRSVRALPTNKQKLELQRSTGTAATTASTDRQMDKADRYMREMYGEDFDLDDPYYELDTEGNQVQKGTLKDEYRDILTNPKREGVQLHYDKDKDDWVLAGAYASPEDIQTDKEIQAAAGKYGLQKTDMQLGEDGEWTPKEGVVNPKYGDTWGDMGDGTMGWLDDGEEQYYSPDGQKMSKEAAEKYGEKREAKEIERQRKIKKNKLIADFKEAWPGKRVTQSNLDEFAKGGEDVIIDIEEEDGPEPVVEETKTEPVVEEKKTTTTTPTEKPKPSDFRTKKNAFGGTLTAKDQYEKALKDYYSKSPMEMRDNRIYRNAVKGGTVQQNMIKSGYIPE